MIFFFFSVHKISLNDSLVDLFECELILRSTGNVLEIDLSKSFGLLQARLLTFSEI